MTNDDFNEWVRYHQSAFPGLAATIDRWAKGPDAPTRKEILRRWFGTLANTKLADAKWATDRMAAGEIEEPKGYERHPAAIRAAAAGRRGSGGFGRRAPWEEERIRDGEPQYRCLDCLDRGYVRCWSAQSMRAAVDGRLGLGLTLYSSAVPCGCQIGRARFCFDETRFDAKRMLPMDRIENGIEVVGDFGPEEQERLRQFVTALRQSDPRTADDFSDYSN